mmetsp:Transcript_32521/g.92226  ORF Transcript_32521/g.92226 Transcript_32521/m.92226 type:complete len:282 (+) Transcript_32521:3477-4322(+)
MFSSCFFTADLAFVSPAAEVLSDWSAGGGVTPDPDSTSLSSVLTAAGCEGAGSSRLMADNTNADSLCISASNSTLPATSRTLSGRSMRSPILYKKQTTWPVPGWHPSTVQNSVTGATKTLLTERIAHIRAIMTAAERQEAAASSPPVKKSPCLRNNSATGLAALRMEVSEAESHKNSPSCCFGCLGSSNVVPVDWLSGPSVVATPTSSISNTATISDRRSRSVAKFFFTPMSTPLPITPFSPQLVGLTYTTSYSTWRLQRGFSGVPAACRWYLRIIRTRSP